jgi:hypothetical protein
MKISSLKSFASMLLCAALSAQVVGCGFAPLSREEETSSVSDVLAASRASAWDARYEGFGGADFVPVPADYDGDGRADLSVKNAAGGWYIDFAANGSGNCDALYQGFRGPELAPVPADYDGDGSADLATSDSLDDLYIDFATPASAAGTRSTPASPTTTTGSSTPRPTASAFGTRAGARSWPCPQARRSAPMTC